MKAAVPLQRLEEGRYQATVHPHGVFHILKDPTGLWNIFLNREAWLGDDGEHKFYWSLNGAHMALSDALKEEE